MTVASFAFEAGGSLLKDQLRIYLMLGIAAKICLSTVKQRSRWLASADGRGFGGRWIIAQAGNGGRITGASS